MKNTFLLLSLFYTILTFGQVNSNYTIVDAKMNNIPANFTNSTTEIAAYIDANFKKDTDKIRAAFYWIASNIRYDVANMYAVNYNESVEDKINGALKSKKGVCIHYAAIFNELAYKMRIQSYVIEGYNKQNGKVGDLAHAWNAAKVDNKWYLFDPTWASGYVNNGQFFKKLNNVYFMADPAKLIASHIPFDYLWQFLKYPITNGDFYEGKIQVNKLKIDFDYEKEIVKYNALSEIDQLFESADRIQKNGLKNKLIVDRYEWNNKKLINLRNNNSFEKLNAIVNEMNEAVLMLNDFIQYRNNKFRPNFSDDVIRNMILVPKQKFLKSQKEIYKIGDVGAANEANLSTIKKSISTNLAQAEEHDLFVQNYLSKSKLVRKTMFSKMSWLGIPLN